MTNEQIAVAQRSEITVIRRLKKRGSNKKSRNVKGKRGPIYRLNRKRVKRACQFQAGLIDLLHQGQLVTQKLLVRCLNAREMDPESGTKSISPQGLAVGVDPLWHGGAVGSNDLQVL